MYLDRLEIAGFKSFAQKVSFTFNRGITAIVGPNGSGKSNIADGIRWALGEQSMKSLRGRRSEDVIFSGSEKSARLGFAEVALTLNNEDRRAPLDYSELTISRKVYRSGEGEYLLNRQASRLTDITMLLARLHLGSRTYSVIGQGMVDAILALSPFERKDFFDEAAGVKPYELKREEALRKLEASGENLRMALVQLQELTPRVRYLTRQVRRLERRDEIMKELRALLERHFGAEWKRLQEEMTRLQGRGASQRTAREALTKEVSALQKDMSSLTRESAHAASFDTLQKEYQKFLKEKTRLKEDEVNIKMRVAVRSREHLKTAVPLSIVREASVKLKKLHEEYGALVGQLQGVVRVEEVQGIAKKLQELVQRFESVEAVFDPYLRVEADDNIQDSLTDVGKQVEAVDAQLARLQGDLEALAIADKEEREKIWHVQQKLQSEQQKLNDAVAAENATRVEAARVETRRDDVAREAQEEFEKYGGAADLDGLAAKVQGGSDLAEIHRLKNQLEQIGGIDPEIEKEYKEISARHTFLETHVEDLKKAIGDLEVVIGELDRTIEAQFIASFKQIDEGFQRYFKTLFGGGRAKLVLVKEVKEVHPHTKDFDVGAGEVKEKIEEEKEEIEDPVKKFLDKHTRKDHIGVEIHATPPGKRLSSVNALSGGERALTSIALIASIIANNPAPFVVLDEVDAALDEANSIRFSAILEELSAKTQFVIITHNRATMEKADILYGVTMGEDGISKVLSLKLEDAVKHGNR